jgi:magnesium transporter
MDYIRQRSREVEVLDYIYVVGEDGKLLGDVQLKNLLIAQPEQRVSELMDGKYLFLKVTDTQESAIPIFKQYDRSALPVVSEDGIMLGIVTIDDVLDIVEEANTEDIQRFGGLEALDTPYIRTPVMEMVKKRAGWLVLLFLSEMLTATAMGHFENEIARAVVLALFVPLIISSGGNSGSQAATLIIRAMALKEIWLKDWWRVMKREAISGFCLGCVLGLIGFLRIAIWTLFTDIYGPHWLYIALTVSCSLVGVVMWGTLAGSMMPFLLRRLGFDPASSSAPFVATLVDVTGLVIYFSVASLFLRGILL